ncbi:MAG: hypothetical protein WB770_01195 [Acidimicrobiales bacterium]
MSRRASVLPPRNSATANLDARIPKLSPKPPATRTSLPADRLDADVRRAPPTAALTIRTSAAEGDVAKVMKESLDLLRHYMHEHHIAPDGPAFALQRPLAQGRVDVEVGWPIASSDHGEGPIHRSALPSSLVRHHARMDVDRARRALLIEDGLRGVE